MASKGLRIGYLSTSYHTALLLLGSTELAENLGAPPQWKLFGTGPAMVNAMEAGELDAGYLGLPPAIIGIARGVPIRCVAGGHVEGTNVVGKRKHASLAECKDDLGRVLKQFEGQVVGVPSKGSIHDVILAGILKEYGLTDKIDVKHYKQAEYIALDMESGKIEAGVGTPALAVFASMLLDARLVVAPHQLWPYNPSYGVFFHEDLIKNDPALVETFVLHHRYANEVIRVKPIEASEKIARVMKIVDPDYILATLMISPKYCISLPREYIDTTMQLATMLKELGYIDAVPPEERVFTLDFTSKLHPERHHYYASKVYKQIIMERGKIVHL